MLRRARLLLVAAIVLAGVLLTTEFPLSDLVRARAAAANLSAELAKVTTADKSLATQVHDLTQGSTIEQIAHQEYGLVEPGQRSVVVMPGGGATQSTSGKGGAGTSAPLGETTIPRSDLMPSDSQAGQVGAAPAKASGGGFWQKVLHRLEFWKASV